MGLVEAFSVTVRAAGPDDAEAIARVHYDAVHGIAAADYRPEIIAQWAPPIDEARIAAFRDTADTELRIVAELQGVVVGFGALIPGTNEVRACYVAPTATRLGAGRAIIRELERIAREAGLSHLEMDSSLTAERFYRACGYASLGRGVHRLSSGSEMSCIRMRKTLT